MASKLFVYGGWDGQTLFGDFHEMDMLQGAAKAVQMEEGCLEPRAYHSMVSFGTNELIVFGGFTSAGEVSEVCRITVGEGSAHGKTLLTSGTGPCPRQCHSALRLGSGLMAVYGGKNQSTVFGDIWVLDLHPAVPTWHAMRVSTKIPARFGAIFVLAKQVHKEDPSVVDYALLLHGGCTMNLAVMNDLSMIPLGTAFVPQPQGSVCAL